MISAVYLVASCSSDRLALQLPLRYVLLLYWSIFILVDIYSARWLSGRNSWLLSDPPLVLLPITTVEGCKIDNLGPLSVL